MVNASATGYQTTVAYQGGQANAQQQAKAQPKLAPAADTQQGGQRSKQDPSSDRNRGKTVDVSA